jgi:hypothetical protein
MEVSTSVSTMEMCVVKMLVTGAILATLVASPAVAQSYDPSIGSGNIVRYADPQNETVDRALYNYSRTNANQRRTARRANPSAGGNGGAQFQSPYSAYGAVTPFGSPGVAQNGANQMSGARAAAVRECSTMAQRYQDTTWGSTMKSHHYRTCMVQRGQVE